MKTKDQTPAQSDVAATDILKSLDKQWLADRIARQKQAVQEAVNELRSLQTLEKARAIRAGELRRAAPATRKPRSAATPATAAPPVAATPTSTESRIETYLAHAGPSRDEVIAAGLQLPLSVVRNVLASNRRKFGGKNGLWQLRGSESDD